MDDLISRHDAIDALEKVAELYPWRVPGDRDSYSKYNEAWNDALDRAESEIEALPSAQSESDKEKISELLMRLYLIQSAHLTKEGIVRKQHYCEELWKAIFHDDELPVWMHWYDIEREKSQ